MSLAKIRQRLAELERSPNEAESGGASKTLIAKLERSAEAFLAQGMTWESFPRADHVAAAATAVERAECSLAGALGRARTALVDGVGHPAGITRTAEQVANVRRNIAREVDSARVQLWIAEKIAAVADADPRRGDDHRPVAASPSGQVSLAHLSTAEYLALAATRGLDPPQTNW